MKNKHDQGFSLVEILVAIVILAAFVVPTCSALVLTAKMNEKTDDLMKAQLAVSSAVETLMAEGIPSETGNTPEDGDYGVSSKEVDTVVTDDNGETKTVKTTVVTDRFPEVKIKVASVEGKPWYTVEVSDNDGRIVVNTSVRKVNGGDGA